jgi:hypothetical protein
MDSKIVNLGCGQMPIEGAINVDLYSGLAEVNKDALEYLSSSSDNSIDVLHADHFLEHLGFEEEKTFFMHLKRCLSANGVAHIKVPDFEWLCKTFLSAEENAYEFYTTGEDAEYFGGGYDTKKRWSVLMATFFGHQDGGGQLHRNGFTRDKFTSIASILGMQVEISTYKRKATICLHATFTKIN